MIISIENYIVLQEWYKNFIDDYIVIYLQTSPDTSYDRMIKRQRPEENGVSYDYIYKLHCKYDSWLINRPNTIIIDANKDFENNEPIQNIMMDKVFENL